MDDHEFPPGFLHGDNMSNESLSEHEEQIALESHFGCLAVEPGTGESVVIAIGVNAPDVMKNGVKLFEDSYLNAHRPFDPTFLVPSTADINTIASPPCHT
ncbi:unnamed protein product [Pleuronectes platessa]|uniref:Uncharacterized protein n=1 Tax=Pleuronectes platessa TaxID=8262 RepID=A0A9N7U1B9_PLEPL|nr:unnamed protein product [Pleuronectes platessa]